MVRAGHAIFDDAGNALQLRLVSECAREERRSERVARSIDGEEADAAGLHATRGAAVVPERQSVAQGTGRQEIEKTRRITWRRATTRGMRRGGNSCKVRER